MSGSWTPPASRDLPDGALERMRAQVMQQVEASTGTATFGWRVIAPVAAVAVVAAAIAVPAMINSAVSGGGETFAFGTGKVSPRLQRVIDECERDAYGKRVGMAKGSLRLVNRGEAGDYALAVLMDADNRLVVCDGNRDGVGGSYDPANGNMWLPGPISVDSLSSTEWSDSPNGGDVFVAGRLSERVAKVVLDHGNGDTTIARLDHGTYAVATGSGGVVVGNAKVIAYDRDGKSISQKPLRLSAGYGVPGCWVDDAGKVVYGTGSNCEPAERWLVASTPTKSPTT